MDNSTSVVTPERFEQGLTYQDYLAQVNVNKDQFLKFYDQLQLSNEDVDFFRKANQHPEGPTRMLVVGEDW